MVARSTTNLTAILAELSECLVTYNPLNLLSQKRVVVLCLMFVPWVMLGWFVAKNFLRFEGLDLSEWYERVHRFSELVLKWIVAWVELMSSANMRINLSWRLWLMSCWYLEFWAYERRLGNLWNWAGSEEFHCGHGELRYIREDEFLIMRSEFMIMIWVLANCLRASLMRILLELSHVEKSDSQLGGRNKGSCKGPLPWLLRVSWFRVS